MAKNDNLTEHQKRTLWFVKIRWMAILIMTAVIFISKYIGGLNVPVPPCLIILGLTAVYNIIYPIIILRFEDFASNPTSMYLRMVIDVMVITFLVHFTGGIESPFELLYLVEVSAVAMFGFTILAYLIAFHAAVFYATTCWMEAALVLHHYRAISSHGTLFLTPSYIYMKSAAVFFFSCLIIYSVSYLADRLRDKQKEIEILSSARLEFMNMVVHELRSPMTSLVEYISLFLDGFLGGMEDRQKETMISMRRQTDRLSRLITDLLDLARMESGRTKLNKKPERIESILEQALQELNPQISKNKIIIFNELEKGLPEILVDRDKILEVFMNLIGNAIKFSPGGGKITIAVSRGNNNLKAMIKDEGHGIAAEDIHNIFNKFYRARHEDPRYKGTGLGLAICESIIELHHGKIWAESPGLGKGASFYFTLPLK